MTNTIEKIKVSAGVVLLDADHKILLGKRKNTLGEGTWGLPGGHVKLGETSKECAIREVKAEIGVDVKDLHLVDVVDTLDTGAEFQLIEVGFKCKKWEGFVELKEGEYCSEWKFFDMDLLPKEIYAPHAPIVKKVVNEFKQIDEQSDDLPSFLDNIHPHFKVAVQTFVVNKEGKLLMGLRCDAVDGGNWAVPGGHLDVGDTLEECAMRELREETGLVAKRAQQFAYIEQPITISNKHYFHFGYIVTDFIDTPVINGEPEDIERWEWFDIHRLPHNIASYQREVIIKFLKLNGINFGKK
jgi:8-oxo-dGTP diphosphatase